jgi:hypothetical protein
LSGLGANDIGIPAFGRNRQRCAISPSLTSSDRGGISSVQPESPGTAWGKLLGDTAAVTALLDRLLHHPHVLKCGPRSWWTKVQTDLRKEEGAK